MATPTIPMRVLMAAIDVMGEARVRLCRGDEADFQLAIRLANAGGAIKGCVLAHLPEEAEVRQEKAA